MTHQTSLLATVNERLTYCVFSEEREFLRELKKRIEATPISKQSEVWKWLVQLDTSLNKRTSMKHFSSVRLTVKDLLDDTYQAFKPNECDCDACRMFLYEHCTSR